MDNILGYYLMPHIPEIIYEIANSNMHRLKNTSEACEEIGREISKIEPETIVILSSHGNLKENSFTINIGEYIYGNFKEFKNVDISFVSKLDNIFSQGIIDCFKNNSINTVNDSESNNYKLDHGSMVPLYFINKYYKNYKLVTINTSVMDDEKLFEFGKAVRKICEIQEKKIVIIASYDIKNNKESKIIDNNSYDKRKIRRGTNIIDNVKVLENLDITYDKFKELQKCDVNYISFLHGALGGKRVNTMLLSYEKPFDTGYAVIKFETH